MKCSCLVGGARQHTVSCLQRSPLYISAPTHLKLASEIEYLCFDFFRHRTGPGFAGYFDSSAWSFLIIQACYTEPVVLQAVAALGAVHRRYELGITPEAFKYCEIADRLERQARRQWQLEAAKQGTVTKPEIHMVLAKLFASFEAFQDHPELATKYMSSAFDNLLRQRVTRVLVQQQPVNVTLNNQTLRQFFLKLEHTAAYLFGISADVQTYNISKIEPGFEMPSTFASVAQARDCLFAEVHHIWALDYRTSTPKDALDMAQRNHLGRLMIWSGAYADWAQTYNPTENVLLKRLRRLLKWYREAAFLQLLLQTTPGAPLDEHMVLSCSGDRTFLANSFHRSHCECTSSMTAHFARLTLLSDGLVDENVPYAASALQYGSSTGMGLHLGSAGCRSSDIRQQMTALLAPSMGGADKVWDAVGVYTIAERVSAFEEEAVENASIRHVEDESWHPRGMDAVEAYPCESSLKWVDITYFMEAKSLCLVYCKPAPRKWVGDRPTDVQPGCVWVREWFQLG
ncbi:uncharacterized protein HMPREF1541_04083 [Cyphellophora europaea CBS 101466]|uniref:Uncharacterized protein n=1 Tax=Cyphellophora europaea (strain CBS 101466) TaxID=1220924 RepID=W2S0C5_CYPE1|nr:uncharacterized protein HMPREF1541_04083 [Cyphellophora europaea CBS 101466]ETN42142.1 hypothetical protein HMPREF1541_04083 [Cyphellophora europaea CBS 101466]